MDGVRNMTDHIIMLSGGLCSFFAAHRVLEQQDRRKVTLLFADTLSEHPDLYRFLDDAEKVLEHPVTRISHGMGLWELFNQQGMIANTQADLCSRIMKRDLCDKWVKSNCAPKPTLHFGFDWSEASRLEGVRRAKPWATCEAPMLEPPYLWKHNMPGAAREMGIEPSSTYADGFEHDNCGGFCVKAGQAHFARLLHNRREVYLYHEQEEQSFRDRTGKDVAVLRDRRGGKTKPLTLLAFRQRIEGGGLFDEDDIGGCNCFAPPETEGAT